MGSIGTQGSIRTQGSGIGITVTEIDIDNTQPPELSKRAESRYEKAASYCIYIGEDSCSRHILGTAEELRQELTSGKKPGTERFIVIHGLPTTYINVLGEELGIEADFIEAFAARRRFHATKGRSGHRATRLEYPELVRSRGDHQPLLGNGRKFTEGMVPLDLLDDPPRYPISHFGEETLLCQASLWECGETSILFLDRPLWHDPWSSLARRRYPISVTKPIGSVPSGSTAWEMDFRSSGTDVGCLEHRLWEHVEAQKMPISLPEVVQDIVLELWAELFECMVPDWHNISDLAAVLWQLQCSIDRNMDAATFLPQKTYTTNSAMPNWQLLSDRVERRMKLAHMLNPSAPPADSPSQPRVPPAAVVKGLKPIAEHERSESEMEQRGLDRVTYLGGILLPFSIVSGILSMGDTFGPWGDMFYVYWAVTVPLTIITLLIIYADSIRRQVVWMQVAADDTQQDPTQDAFSSLESSGMDLEQPVPLGNVGFEAAFPPDNRNYSPVLAPRIVATEKIAAGNEKIVSRPAPLIRPRFSRASRPKTWKKQQLGWGGAAKTIFQLYKIDKPGTPPNLLGSRERAT